MEFDLKLIIILGKTVLFTTIIFLISFIIMRLYWKYGNHKYSYIGFKTYHFSYSIYEMIKVVYILQLIGIFIILLFGSIFLL